MQLIKETKRVREFSADGLIIYEQSPGYRTILGNNKNIHIYFPYLVYIIKDWGGRKTLHVGIRTEKIDDNDFELLFPPLSNIFGYWMLACCKPDIVSFWGSKFVDNRLWLGYSILCKTDLHSFSHWSKLSPIECMEIFRNWPYKIAGKLASYGAVFYNNTIGGSVETRIKFSQLFNKLHRNHEVVEHIRRIR